MSVRAIISQQGQQHRIGLLMCAKLQIRAAQVTSTQHTGALCYSVHVPRLWLMHCDEQNLYYSREKRKLWMAPMHVLIWHCFMVFQHTSPSVRRRARGKLCSAGFIFSCSLQHTVRSEIPSWWRYKYESTKWSYLWSDILQTSSQHWINESSVWHLMRK